MIAVVRMVAMCTALAVPGVVHAREQVTLHLNWTHSFQFAGYYMAEALGYYNDANLSVVIEEGRPDNDVIDQVTRAPGHYGVSVSNLLLARAAGKPVVALAVINQHSPFVLVVREDSTTQSIHDLAGKRVMLQPDGDEILAYLRREGIDPERLQRVEHSFDIRDLVEGRVDAMTGYVTNEPAQLAALGFRHHVYSPRSAGIDFYADNLFTSEAELEAHPERVRAFRAASLRGWKYAMEHPETSVTAGQCPDRAARNGKDVTVVIELRARVDEEANLPLADRLQEAGVQVVYGVLGYKTHAKMLLIVRREGRVVQRYVHLGTGNYHSGTARLYTDIGLLTANAEIGDDVHLMFTQMSGLSPAIKLK